MAVRDQRVSKFIEHYNSLLDDPKIAAGSLDALHQGQRETNLMFGGRPLSISLRPQLVERPRWERVVLASETIYGALSRLEELLLAEAELRRELDLDPGEEELILAELPCNFSSPSSRLDGFFTDELRFVEYNAESPAGMAYYDTLVDVFDRLPVMKEFRKRYSVTALHVQDLQLDTMLRGFREWGGADTPVIAIVDWQDVPTLTEQQMFKEQFERNGIQALMCDPRALEFRNGKLYADGIEANFVYRRVLTTELLSRGKEASAAICEAYKQRAVCVINTFRAKLLHRKLSLGLLTDERTQHIYSKEQKDAIARHVPWTRKVKHGATVGHDGEPIGDLLDYISKHRDELVLKPNDDYGGKGVALGWDVDQETWDQALRAALADSYVVQKAVPVPREPYPVALDGLQMLDLAVDIDPFLFEGKVKGCLTRLSSSALLNVTSGAGSSVPAYIVETTA